MPEPPRRKRFQIHLSTAIVMMFVAGALIWANLDVKQNDQYSKDYLVAIGKPNGRFHSVTVTKSYGWPFRFLPWSFNRVDTDGNQIDGEIWEFGVEWYLGGVFDLLIWISILYSVWYFSERRIRRSAVRKAP